MNIQRRNAQFLSALSGLTERQKEYLAEMKARQEAVTAALDQAASEMVAEIKAEKSKPSLHLVTKNADDLQWDYDKCGSYRNTEWGE